MNAAQRSKCKVLISAAHCTKSFKFSTIRIAHGMLAFLPSHQPSGWLHQHLYTANPILQRLQPIVKLNLFPAGYFLWLLNPNRSAAWHSRWHGSQKPIRHNPRQTLAKCSVWFANRRAIAHFDNRCTNRPLKNVFLEHSYTKVKPKNKESIINNHKVKFANIS